MKTESYNTWTSFDKIWDSATKTSKKGKVQIITDLFKTINYKLFKTSKYQIGWSKRLIYTSKEAIETCHSP